MVDYEQRIREAAYYLWEAEGRPEGRAEMHWRMAEIAIVLLGYLSQGLSELPSPGAWAADPECPSPKAPSDAAARPPDAAAPHSPPQANQPIKVREVDPLAHRAATEPGCPTPRR